MSILAIAVVQRRISIVFLILAVLLSTIFAVLQHAWRRGNYVRDLGNQPYALSKTRFYRNHYEATHHGIWNSEASIREWLRAELRYAKSQTIPNRTTLHMGVTVEPSLAKKGYIHDDLPINPVCPPSHVPYGAKPPCLSVITNSYFGTSGTAIQTSTGTVYEMSGGCCENDWKLHLNKTYLLHKRQLEGRIVFVLNAHHSSTYHHVIHEVLPRYLSFAWLIDAVPEILVAIDAGDVTARLLMMLGLPRERIVRLPDVVRPHWTFASVLLYPPPVFGHEAQGHYRPDGVRATAGVLRDAALENGANVSRGRGTLVLMERALRRDSKGQCREQRCLRNFGELRAALERRFRGVYDVVVYGANDGVRRAVEVFSSADVVVGVHGAGFQNMMFCRPGTVVVHVGWARQYEKLAKEFGLQYFLSKSERMRRESVGFVADVRKIVGDVTRATEGATAALAGAQNRTEGLSRELNGGGKTARMRVAHLRY